MVAGLVPETRTLVGGDGQEPPFGSRNFAQSLVGSVHGFKQVLIVTDGHQPGDPITVTDLDGEVLIEHTRPTSDVKYVGNGRPSGGNRQYH